MDEEKANEMMREMVKAIRNLRKDVPTIINIKHGNNQLTKEIKNELNKVASNLYEAEIILNKISN